MPIPALLSLLLLVPFSAAGPRLARSGRPGLSPTPPTSTVNMLTFTVVATVAPTINSWPQVLQHICPAPAPVPQGLGPAVGAGLGHGSAGNGGLLEGYQASPAGARRIVYLDTFAAVAEPAHGRVAEWEEWQFLPTLVHPIPKPADQDDSDDGDKPHPGPHPPKPHPPPARMAMTETSLVLGHIHQSHTRRLARMAMTPFDFQIYSQYQDKESNQDKPQFYLSSTEHNFGITV
ncbi:unnamed protein product [Parascedosporium putredinis]|uniref:Uncharacterized protein n=1 Tax=Parascedosporium putredinis TaxID=1442378 RepID=A0A9P1H6N0_9PEZI|nr:unnamed protein product [Parascedosporium putredinis]CAI8000570.1 unnamed protein product [Parascedosporium putredinis]